MATAIAGLASADGVALDLELRRRRWLRGLLAPKVFVGIVIVLFFAFLALFGPLLMRYAPGAITGPKLRAPSAAHWLGTTQQGQDVLAQVVDGARVSMAVGFGAGILTTVWSILVGLTGGYVAGTGSEMLSMFSNVFLVLPSLPLVVILASYMPNSGALGIIIVITVTGWAWGARVLRAQTLSLRKRDFVEAARATGEAPLKIMMWDVLPNEVAIIAATFLGSVVAAILTEASIAFLGLSSVTQWSWGTILYWAQNGEAELAGAWWWFVPPGLCIALVGTGLAFINFGIDDLVNPRLRQELRSPKRPRQLSAKRAVAQLRRPTGSGDRRLGVADVEGAPVAGTLLELRNVSVDYRSGSRPVRAVNDVSLTLRRGEVLGIAGESGSGKSTLARAITRLLRAPAGVAEGEVLYSGRSGDRVNVLEMDERQLRKFRWEEVAIVFQSAMNALNPVLRLGTQIDDVLREHRPHMRSRERRARIVELLELVGISRDRATSYPHELSGGMRQRSLIAMALALEPEIIVMDEPTTALDVVIQRQVIETILRLKEELQFAVIFITHDLSLLIELCDTIAVMYAGRMVEIAAAEDFYKHPRHPYSRGLLGSFPTLTGPKRDLVGVAGSPPDLRRLPVGCAFAPRCPEAMDVCNKRAPDLKKYSEAREAEVACFLCEAARGARIEEWAEGRG